MFCKFALLAFVAPLVSALTLQVPENPTSGGSITLKWNSAQGDPDTWTFELINTAFNRQFAIANNVNPQPQELTLTIPIVPVGDGYTVQAVNIGDINQVYAETASFSIGETSTSSTTSSSTSSGSSSSGSITPSNTRTSLTSTSTSKTGVSTTLTTPSSSSTTSTSGTGTPTPFNNNPTGAALSNRLGLNGPIVAVVLSAVAGAAMIAL